MVVNCEHVWREISDYLEGDVSPDLRAAMEAHFKVCKHCQAVLDGTRNVMTLYGDDRAFELPVGFDQRLRRRLAQEVSAGRPRSGMVWMLAVAAGALLVGSFALARASSSTGQLLSEHAQPGKGIPGNLLVEVSTEGKLFHVPGCKYLHEKPSEHPRSMTAAEAIRDGYAPCIRCLRKYVLQSVGWRKRVEDERDSGEGLQVASGRRTRP
jgi:putative zinc finger protein